MQTPHDGKDYVLACECPGCCRFREQAKAIGCTPFELAQEMAKFPADHFKLPTSTIGTELRSVSFVQGSFSIDPECKVIEPLHKRSGTFDPITLHLTSERDSAEADAAQALFVEFGMTSKGIINTVFGGVPMVLALIKVKASNPGHVVKAMLDEIAALYNVPISRLLGSAPTAEAEHNSREYYVALAMDASQRNEKLKQELIRQYTNAAAYKLGASAKTYLTRDERNAAKKGIKGNLAKDLRACGVPYSEIESIVSELVEGLKNV